MDVLVLMGSASDLPQMRPGIEVLDQLALEHEVHVTSAHRTPQRTLDLVHAAVRGGCEAIICGAGMAAHLAGFVAAHTRLPVLGVPLKGGVLDGMDALLATVQMPPGVPVATFGVGSAGARNAAFFAAALLATRRPDVAERLEAARDQAARRVEAAQEQVVSELSGAE